MWAYLPEPAVLRGQVLRAGITLAAIALLNVALTFHNIWPTPWIRLSEELSLEAAALVLILAIVIEWRGALGRVWTGALATLLALLVIGRYADVTAPALFGRAINVYWDIPHVPKVAAMVAAVTPGWLLAIYAGLVVTVFAAVAFGARWTAWRLNRGLAELAWLRRGCALGAAGLLLIYAMGMQNTRMTMEYWFALPVTPVYVAQAEIVIDNLRPADDAERFGDRPLMASDLSRLDGRDVFLMFFESYGATVFDTPHFRAGTQPAYDALDAFVAGSDWTVVSALMAAPTTGGGSWLSHASVLSGVRVDDQAFYQAFLRSRRHSLIHRFRGAKYRTVALMPGIKTAWPEGAAMGFDVIYDAAAMRYDGPPFGWWTIPDQYSLNRLLTLEFAARERKPRFVFFASISSHMPFQPTPPYIADWRALAGPNPYGVREGSADSEAEDLRIAYIRAVRYNLNVLRGFLGQRAPGSALVIAMGDHQPPSMVSGKAAPWAVPVHVFARERRLLAPFVAAGFRSGLIPEGDTVGGLEALNTILLRGFDSGPVDTAGRF